MRLSIPTAGAVVAAAALMTTPAAAQQNPFAPQQNQGQGGGRTAPAPATPMAPPPSTTAPAGQWIDANMVSRIAEVLQEEGYRAQLGTDSQGGPRIQSASSGINWSIYFYGCDDNFRDCTSIQFSAGFDLTDGISFEAMNEWNYNKRYAKAYVDREFDPYLKYDLNMDGGITEAALRDSIDIWRILLGQFTEHINW